MSAGSRLLPILLVLALPVNAARAQGAGGFDLESLQLPPGFLDLSDIVIVGAEGGSFTATATTTLANARSLALFSFSRGPTGKRQTTIALKPEDWSLTESIPALANPALDDLTLSNVAIVITDQDVRLPSAMLPDAERAFYSEVYHSDDFTLVLKPGINLIATIPAEGLPAGHPLVAVMDALGIEKGAILLQGTLGKSLTLLRGGATRDAIKDLYLRAELPPMRPAGSPEWFRSGQLALELTGDPSVRLVGEMNVLIDEHELEFFLAAMLARTGVSLAGGMQAEEPWVSPFGVEWLTLKKVVLKIGITPTGSVALGFAGAAVIGEKDVDVAVALAVSPAGVPTNFMMKGESEAGVALSDLAQVQAAMTATRERAAGDEPGSAATLISLDALPDIHIRSMGLQFAPKPDLELGIERGFKLKGQLWLPTGPGGEMKNFAGVDAGVTDDGLWINGKLGVFQVGPLTWDDAVLDLAATRQAQHLIVKGQVQLGPSRQLVDLSITREALRFRSASELFGLFHADLSAQAAFDLSNPSFQVDGVARNDFGQFIQPVVADGIVRFAQGGQVLINGIQATLLPTRQTLQATEATVAELYAFLQARRATAESNWRAAQAEATRALAEANAAYAAMENARRALERTPLRQPALRAQYRAEQLRWAGILSARSGRYAAVHAVANAQRAILDAIPPVEQNVLMLEARAALAELRGRLQEAERNLAALEAQLSRLIAAIESGATPFSVERAEFHASLALVQAGGAMNWKIQGVFVGRPYEISRSLDFASPAAAAAEMVTALVGA